MEKYKELINEALNASPGRISEIAVELSGYYARLADELENVLVFKADRWLELRGKDHIKSDTMASRLWDATTEGKQEIQLRSQTKYLEKFISSLKLRLRVMEGESRNLY